MFGWLKRLFGWGEPEYISLGSIQIDPLVEAEQKHIIKTGNLTKYSDIADAIRNADTQWPSARREENKKKFEPKPAAAYAGYSEPSTSPLDTAAAVADAIYWQQRHQEYVREAAEHLVVDDLASRADILPAEAVPEPSAPEPIIQDVQPYCQEECGWTNTPTNKDTPYESSHPVYEPTPTPSYTPDPSPSPSYDPPSYSSGDGSSSYDGGSYDSGGSCGGDSGGGCGSCD